MRKLEIFGHVCRMKDTRLVMSIMFGMFEGTNKRGRSKREWLDVTHLCSVLYCHCPRSLFAASFCIVLMYLYSLLYLDVTNAINERYCLKLNRGSRGPVWWPISVNSYLIYKTKLFVYMSN